MVFRSRSVQLFLVALLVAAAVFTYATACVGFWANAAIGSAISVALFILVGATFPKRSAVDPDLRPSASAAPQSFHVLLDQMPIPVVSCSHGEPPQAVNRAARALFHTDDAILSGGDEIISALEGPASAARPILRVKGHRYAVSVSEIISEAGLLRLGTLTDVQTEIHKAEASALRDTLHILSHEIMNSLTPVSSLANIADSYLAEEDSPSVQSAREALEMLSRRASSLTRFIEAYRSVARLPEPKLQPVEPGRLLQDIMNLCMHNPAAGKVEFGLDLGENLPSLALDEPQVSQALINVLTNAIEASPRKVSVAVRHSHQDVIVEISDDGEGIPESIRAELFTAFATTKPKGTGTGLNLARQIALAHGGNLQLLADEGAGQTTFAFTFPVT